MKKRFIACVIACALLLIGTGYAYWTDMFSITGSVNTGKFEVKLTESDLEGAISDLYPVDLLDKYNHAEANVDKVKTPSSAVTLQIKKLFPGYGYKFKFKAENLGDVAAKLSAIRLDKTGISDLQNVIGIRLTATIKDRVYVIHPILGVTYETEVADIPDGDVSFKIKNNGFVALSKIEDINIASNTLFLDTDNSYSEMVIELDIAMDPDAEGEYTSGTWLNGDVSGVSDDNTENKNGTLKLELLWDQYNAKAAVAE